MTLLDYIIVAVFFLLVALGHLALSPLVFAGLFAALAVGRLLRGEKI